MLKHGFHTISSLGDHIIRLFAACGSLEEAYEAFSSIVKPSVFTWNSLISAHLKLGEGHVALKLYERIREEGINPDRVTFISVCNACGSIGSIVNGMTAHHQAIQNSFESDTVLGNAIIDMYAKCGCFDEAWKLFELTVKADIITWTVIISGYSSHGHGDHALKLFTRMHEKGIIPNKAILLCALRACSYVGSIYPGYLIHEEILEYGLELDAIIMSSVIDMYAKSGSLSEAQKVFSDLRSNDVVSWGALIDGYAQNGQGHAALKSYINMLHGDVTSPNEVVFLGVLKACGNKNAIKALRLVHFHIIQIGCEQNMITGSTLIDTYIKCDEVEDACHVFECLTNKDVVAWGAMITGYALHGHDVNAFELFRRMQQEGTEPNGITILYILKSCGATGSIEQGRLVHHQFASTGLPMDVVVGSTLVEMYANCGSLDEARNIFDYMPNKNIVSWGALIAGYALYGNLDQVQCCLDEMQQHGDKPVDAMFTSILAACSHSGQLNKGCEHFRAMLETYDIMPKAEHFNCMVDIFARRGHLNEAEDLLQTMPTPPDPIVWTSLLNSSKVYGSVTLGRHCFNEVFPMDLEDASSYTLMSDIYLASGMHER